MHKQKGNSIKIDGADQAFDIYWDKSGIAHVYAATVADAYRGMGYAAGSERLWQIHLSTLYATGSTASVLGSRFVSQDLMHRCFDVPAYDLPDSPGDWVVDAYLDGLNSYIGNLQDVPPEFSRAGTLPRKFTRQDVASRYRFIGWFQHKSWMEKIYISKLMARHGTEWFERHVRRFSTADARCISELQQALLELDPAIGKLLYADENIVSGSNNWAISADLSASGAPMLATDPHQPHTIPNVFFYVHLHAPDWDAFGASFPGVPYFMMGFNRDLAWGLTTGFIDNYDVFVERDHDFETRKVEVDVAGEVARTYAVAYSSHGPILESLTDVLGLTEKRSRDYWTALSWVMQDIPTSAGALALLPLATNSQEFGEALFEKDVCPLVNNIICVDRHNDLRRFMAATIPKRQSVTGIVPLPGWETFEFELSCASDLLVEHNPESGFALTANNDTMGEGGDFPIHNFPAASARADRIRELLTAKKTAFTSTYFESMQLDLLDVKAREWVPDIVACLVDDDPAVQRAREILSGWDYVASMDSQAACIYYRLLDKRWHIAFMHEVLSDDLLLSMPVVAPGLSLFSIADFMQEGSPWRQHRSVLERIICEKTSEVITDLDKEFGEDWTWGQIHQIRFRHSLAKHEPWTNLAIGPDAIAGSPTTLAMAMHLPAVPGSEKLQVFHGPAFRWVVDLSDPLHFRFVIAGGNGGNNDSQFATNQYQRWLNGEYLDVSLLLEEIDIAYGQTFSP